MLEFEVVLGQLRRTGVSLQMIPRLEPRVIQEPIWDPESTFNYFMKQIKSKSFMPGIPFFWLYETSKNNPDAAGCEHLATI